MKRSSIALLVTMAGLVAAPGLAMADSDIHGRSEFAIESALRAQGVQASGIESWGDYVRAYVSNGNGGSTMAFFDADTLQPVTL